MNRVQQNIVYLQSGSPETEHRVADGYSGGQLGTTFDFQDMADAGRVKNYRLVQNDSVLGTVPFTGAVAWWKDRARYLVTPTIALAGRGNPAGIYRCASDVNEIVCVQKKGLGTVKFVDAPTAAPTTAGLMVIPSATDAKADALAAGNSATYPQLGLTEGTQDATTKLALVALDVEDGSA